MLILLSDLRVDLRELSVYYLLRIFNPEDAEKDAELAERPFNKRSFSN